MGDLAELGEQFAAKGGKVCAKPVFAHLQACCMTALACIFWFMIIGCVCAH